MNREQAFSSKHVNNLLATFEQFIYNINNKISNDTQMNNFTTVTNCAVEFQAMACQFK